MKTQERKEYMTQTDKAKVKAAGKSVPRTHENMKRITGKARPGKTAKDRANKGL